MRVWAERVRRMDRDGKNEAVRCLEGEPQDLEMHLEMR